MALALADFEREIHRLVERGLNSHLQPVEIADALQNELDELEATTGEALRSPIVQVPEGQ